MKGLATFWFRFRRNRAAVAGAVVLTIVVLAAIFGPWLYPVDPFDMVGRPYTVPLDQFPLGTDVAGRDILAGILHGARISLLIGLLASLAATIVGVTFGAIAGYYGGHIDNLLMRTTEIMPNALPPVIVVASLMVATAILTESGLSFLGLSDPNLVSWGYMIGVARTALRTAWWMAAIPGLMIVITVLAINLIGEGLNDALNPKLRK